MSKDFFTLLFMIELWYIWYNYDFYVHPRKEKFLLKDVSIMFEANFLKKYDNVEPR